MNGEHGSLIQAPQTRFETLPQAVQDVRIIPLTRGQVALVDEQDWLLLSSHKWHALKIGNVFYAARSVRDENGKRCFLYMHREILGAGKEAFVDHIDGNGLNNRRTNLRLATKQQNSFNQRPRSSSKSGYKGVHWHKGARKWRAQITTGGVCRHLGYFDCIESAARAYDDAAQQLHGDFARSNLEGKS